MERFREQSKRKAITFSMDDGVTQDIRMIELLNKYNLKCTFNLNSELLGQPRMLMQQGQRISHYKVAPEQVAELYAGHEVAVHTLTHPNLTRLTDAEVIRQVTQDQENLEQLVGYPVVGMAYPCGGVNHDDRVAKLIREHTTIRYCRNITNTDSFDPQEDLYKLCPNTRHREWDRVFSMAEKFLAMKPEKPQIFYIWGHTYEMDFDSENWAKLEELFRLISGREDIFYGTNAQVLL